MNTTATNNRENMNRVNNKLTAEEIKQTRGTADTMATPTADDWKLITLDANDPAAVVVLYCQKVGETAPRFTAGWTDRAAALAWFEREKEAHKADKFTRIIEETPTRLVFEPKRGTAGRYVHELRDADPLADIISEAKRQEARTVSGLNYGPIKYLRDRVLYATNGKTTAENMTEYESNLHRVTDADTYAAYLLSSYDVFVDETQVYCDLRRAFPSLTFAELCRLIRDHMGENQQGNGIAAALVPDVVILSSADEYTREKFRERHEKFYKLSSYWKGEEVNTNRESDLKKHYDRESLAVHFLLSEELYYTWGEDRAARCLDNVREIYPDMTAQELRDIRDKYADAVGEIYG